MVNTYKPIEVKPEDVTVEHLYEFLLTIKTFAKFDNTIQQWYFTKHITEYESYTVWFDMRYMGFCNCCLLGLFIKFNNLQEPDKADVQTVSAYFKNVPEDILQFAFFTYEDDNCTDFTYHLNRTLTFLRFYIHEK